ncbi:MAG TPA: aminoglycoside phosphotransferase family protein [Patescibacteria group bacterium]|nr:aminoglycoside phosphotransferase family protein [Patescibacteria group bacterium]
MTQTDTSAKADHLLAQIAKAFPELTWQGYTYLDEGWDHEVIILDNKVVFRFPDDDEYLTKLAHEIEVLHYLRPSLNVLVPHYTYLPKPLSFAGYPIIKGETLTKVFFDSLPPVERKMVARQLADFLTCLHTQALTKPPLKNVPETVLADDQHEVREGTATHLKSVLSPQDYDLAQQILGQVDGLIGTALPHVFIHNDIYSRHLLWDAQKRQLGVIDFSDMCLGDPAVDFAELHEYGFGFVQEVYEQYEGPKDPEFLNRAWLYQEWIGVYMMTDHFAYNKTSFAVARETFDRVKAQGKDRI